MGSISTRIKDDIHYAFDDFFRDVFPKEEKTLIALFQKFSFFFENTAQEKSLSPKKRMEDFCFYMKNIKAKRRYWEQYAENVIVSPVSEVFASSLMRKIKEQGIEGKIRSVIRKEVPHNLNIDSELTDYFPLVKRTILSLHLLLLLNRMCLGPLWQGHSGNCGRKSK